MKTKHASAFALTLLLVAACGDREAAPSDFDGFELTSAQLKSSPTNAFADDARAAALGQALFFDRGLSSEGTVACVDCHDPQHGFSDPKARSVGVRKQVGDRHSMPVTTAAMQTYLLWDGKADSVWSQPLKAIENPKEMDFTRTEVAHRVSETYRAQYEAVFGAVPDLSSIPRRAKPGDDAWAELTASSQDSVQRMFANVGKAIEAYERKLLCTNTRFDRWLRGDGFLSESERQGAATFRRQGCTRCHSGPIFSDGKFHDLGLPSTDRGRALGAPALLSDPFNGAGAYSDDRDAGRTVLATVPDETAKEGAFRTASLRGVGQRTFFAHSAHRENLRDFIIDVYRGRGGRGRGDRGGGGRTATVGTVDPQLDGVNVDGDDVDDLVAFLRTLDCPAPPPELVVAPTQ